MVVALHLDPAEALRAGSAARRTPPQFQALAFIKITADGMVTIIVEEP